MKELLKRMKEIRERLTEIRTATAEPEADLDALEEESRALTREYETLEERKAEIERRKRILNGAKTEGITTRTFTPEREPEERTFGVDTPEFRIAFLKSLQGKPLDEEERAAVSAAKAIPTQTLNMIVGKLEKNPLLAEVDMMHIPGNISIPVSGTVNAASWLPMETASTDSEDTIESIDLAAYKLIKTVEITADVDAMAIDAFENWLTTNLANQIEAALDVAIIKGTGTGQATGIATTLSTASGTFNAKGLKFKELMGIIAKLPTRHASNAKFVMSRTLFYGEVLGMETTGGDRVVVADAQAPGKFNILGYPVIIDDNCVIDGKENIIFGDLREYKMNFAKDPEVKRNDSVGFRSGSAVYRAMALVDGKLADTTAIVRFEKATE